MKKLYCLSLPLTDHPLKKEKDEVKRNYLIMLSTFVKRYTANDQWAIAALGEYAKCLLHQELLVEAISDESLRKLLKKRALFSFRYNLICDILFLTAFGDDKRFTKISNEVLDFFPKRSKKRLQYFLDILHLDSPFQKKYRTAKYLVDCWKMNTNFTSLSEKKIIVTATMSAGKSTLINAIIGNPIMRTSQEACTSNLCYLHNKPFEDNTVHLNDSPINLNATNTELWTHEREKNSQISLYFRSMGEPRSRVCLIDTPGVNSAINQNHGHITRKVIVEEKYDTLLYVLNANKLGTDEELNYLKYISENVPKEKTIFVLNKLDEYKKSEDSIEDSIDGIKNDLKKLGYENPVICPISAYFAYLLAMKKCGEDLTEDEQDMYEFYVKHFSKPEYDLSSYISYLPTDEHTSENDFSHLGAKCGLYKLEKILFGG